MKKNVYRKGSECRPTTNESTSTSFRRSWRSNHQYHSVNKNKNFNLLETSHSNSPSRIGSSRMQKASLSPDRKNMYWQNWLLPQELKKSICHEKPSFNSSSVCSLFVDTNEVFLQHNGFEPRQIASLTKIMTAFTVIQICSTYGVKTRQIWVPIQKEASMMQGTTADLRNGQQLLVIDLLYGLMLPSGNDAAIALAMYFGKFLSYMFTHENLYDGDENQSKNVVKFMAQKQFYDAEYHHQSIELFVFEMNKNCQKIGLKNTIFANPTGLTDPKATSTSHDVALLISFSMRNHLLRSIFKKKVYICQSKNARLASTRTIQWKNTNQHLFMLKDCIGVKTGITPGAGPCLSTAYRIMGRQLIVVVLNSSSLEQRYIDSEKIYRHAKQKLQSQHLEEKAKQYLSPSKAKGQIIPLKIELPKCK